MRQKRLAIAISCLVNTILIATDVQAQTITIDGTTPTTVTTTGLDHTITNGTAAGTNLFHSFQRFDIPTGGSATFDLVNTPNLTTIFSRVTGGSVSNIDGAIRTTNSTNPVSLFLMNPSGIIFGSNASLNIGGSFVGTTASSIKFANGAELASTAMPLPTSLLTINVPVGLQMGSTPGAIQVNGTGHRLAASSPTTAPYLSTGAIAGLKVQPGNTLALVGGDIDLIGGTLTAERGRVELGSVGQQALVGLDASASILQLNYATVNQFSNINLSRRAIVDVSGAGAGSIQVQGQQVRLTDGSLLFMQNRGTQTAGDISIRADVLDVIGGIASTNIRSAIVNETRSGNTGSISVATRTLNLIDGGSIFNRSFSTGASGNIYINASESLQVSGYLAANPELFSAIGTVSFSPLPKGRSGQIDISTPRLSLLDGGIITATTFGNAPAGNININADQIEVTGNSPSSFGSSAITSSTFGQGNAGSITVNTNRLLVDAGGTINTTSSSSGAAGSIVVNASQSIKITGSSFTNSSNIGSGVNSTSLATQRLLGLSGLPRGNAGSVTIQTPMLEITDRGKVSVVNNALGNSGKLSITADQIRLDNRGEIAATTAAGEGGNIAIQAQALILRRGSRITATAGGTGNGGNISINAPIIAGFENSDIVANAVKGRGGNIQITTQGIFSLKFRPQLTPDNDITASSQFGVNGTVQINTISVDPSNGLAELSIKLVDPSQQIATGCAGKDGSSFVATGRGGIPVNPTQEVRSDRTWNDTRDLSTFRSPSRPSSPPSLISSSPIVEANAIHRNSDGTIELIATQFAQAPNWQTCARAAKSP
jgi:filamentous hemagglutinin family protein